MSRWSPVHVALVALSVAAAVFLASAQPSPAAVPEVQRATVQRLTIAIPATQPDFTYPYIAQANGYFARSGVQVTFLNASGANAPTLVASGRADLTMFGTPTIFFPALQGRPTSVVYNFIGGGQGGLLAVRSGSPYRRLSDLNGKRVASLGVGGSSYGFANQYSAAAGGDGFNVIPLSDPATIAGSLRAGQIDAAVGPKGWFSAGLADGSFRLLIDTTIPAVSNRWVGGYEAETAIWGLTSNLRKKREAVTRFLVAIARADVWVRTHTPDEIADRLQTLEVFKPVNSDALVDGLGFQAHFWTKYRGHVNQKLWTKSLGVFRRWKIAGLTYQGPEYSYQRRIDMSYLVQALKRAKLKLTPYK
jgi:NitT/TauT family transport system substrate-binding protein